MTTATTNDRPTAKDDPLGEVSAAQDQLEAARKERARLGDKARRFADELSNIDAELGQLAQDEPEQFDAGGLPRPKTKAASLRRKLDQAASSKWSDILAGADERIRQLEAEVRRRVDEHAVELALNEFRAGEDDLAEVDALAERMLAVLSRHDARRTRLIDICSSCRGRIDGRDVTSDERLHTLRILLEQHQSFQPSRSITLTPLVGETPGILRGSQGGWVAAGHGSDSHADQQPERIEARR